MEMPREIRVLIVDDSRLSREMMTQGLEEDPHIRVAATAADPFEAEGKIARARPDVVVCDVVMPKMRGIEFIRRLLLRRSIPVVMVSAVSDAAAEATEAGAAAFLTKPNLGSPRAVGAFTAELRQTVRACCGCAAAWSRAGGGGDGQGGR